MRDIDPKMRWCALLYLPHEAASPASLYLLGVDRSNCPQVS
jgi:hypothetical protein